MPRVLGWLAAGVVFGVAMATLKGQHADLRGTIGNTSAPWIVLPFLAGASCGRLREGAMLGIAVTLAAFGGFYCAEAAVLDLGPHPWYVDLRLAAGTFNVYERLGFVSGSVYGVLGAAWGLRRTPLAGLAVGGAFVAEPLLVWALQREGVWAGGALFDHPALWLGEMLLGTVLLVVGATGASRGRARRTRPRGSTP